jgi:hypothetical protein
VGKILSLGKPFVAGKRLTLSKAVIGDITGQTQLDLWETHIQDVHQNSVYSISPVQLRSFKGEKRYHQSCLLSSNQLKLTNL